MVDVFQKSEFIISAFSEKDFKTDKPHVIFAGRSNVGKSTVINSVLRRDGLARTGGTPGKTISVNYFNIGDSLYFVDLPGYGYAKRSFSQRDNWAALLSDFFEFTKNKCVERLGVLIVDARHEPQESDLKMARYFVTMSTSYIIVANKTDKLKKNELKDVKSLFAHAFGVDINDVLLYSGIAHIGRDELRAEIRSKLNL